MSRFGNLEFGSGQEHSERAQAPLDAAFFMRQASEAFETGRFEQGLRSYARALEFAPKNPAAWTGQVRMLVELGEFSEARLWADKALALFPNDAELLAAKAVALARLGDLQGAISFSDAAVESQTNTPYIWISRGDVLMARKEKRADYCFEKAFTIAGRNWFVLWLAARVHAFHGHFARALKFAQYALALEPARAVLWLETAQAQLALGLPAQARNSLQQARELDPECDTRDLLNKATDSGLFDRLKGFWRQCFRQ